MSTHTCGDESKSERAFAQDQMQAAPPSLLTFSLSGRFAQHTPLVRTYNGESHLWKGVLVQVTV